MSYLQAFTWCPVSGKKSQRERGKKRERYSSAAARLDRQLCRPHRVASIKRSCAEFNNNCEGSFALLRWCASASPKKKSRPSSASTARASSRRVSGVGGLQLDPCPPIMKSLSQPSSPLAAQLDKRKRQEAWRQAAAGRLAGRLLQRSQWRWRRRRQCSPTHCCCTSHNPMAALSPSTDTGSACLNVHFFRMSPTWCCTSASGTTGAPNAARSSTPPRWVPPTDACCLLGATLQQACTCWLFSAHQAYSARCIYVQ